MPKNEVNIKGTKAVIYQNDYGVWQFRIWLADEDKYFRQSLRTKNKEDAIEKGEELFWTIKLDKKTVRKSTLFQSQKPFKNISNIAKTTLALMEMEALLSADGKQ